MPLLNGKAFRALGRSSALAKGEKLENDLSKNSRNGNLEVSFSENSKSTTALHLTGAGFSPTGQTRVWEEGRKEKKIFLSVNWQLYILSTFHFPSAYLSENTTKLFFSFLPHLIKSFDRKTLVLVLVLVVMMVTPSMRTHCTRSTFSTCCKTCRLHSGRQICFLCGLQFILNYSKRSLSLSLLRNAN